MLEPTGGLALEGDGVLGEHGEYGARRGEGFWVAWEEGGYSVTQ